MTRITIISWLVLAFIVLLIVVSSCQQNKIQAENSLRGRWSVWSITIQTGEFGNNSFSESSTQSKTGLVGTFNFLENEVIYSFEGTDKMYANTSPWQLSYQKVNSGFIRVPEYTLAIGNDFRFDVFFEDGTRNAEKNATKASFTQILVNGDTELIILFLEKQ